MNLIYHCNVHKYTYCFENLFRLARELILIKLQEEEKTFDLKEKVASCKESLDCYAYHLLLQH